MIGLLFVKDLIFIDPEDETRVADFVQIFGRGVHVVWPDAVLGDVLRELKQGKSHMALVRDVNNASESSDPFYELKGIITLEDIIEEILGDEIVDETDVVVENSHQRKVDREETFKWARLRLLDSKIVDETLSPEESKAVTAHLHTNYPEVVDMVSRHQLLKLVTQTKVSILPTAAQEVGQELPNDLLYKRGEPSDLCTLVLSGKITVLAGADNFRSTVSSWSLLGSGALGDANYTPDFDAFVSSGPCRCLRLNRASVVSAIDKSVLETRDLSDRMDDQPVSMLYEMDSPSVNLKDDKDSQSPLREESSRKKKLLTALTMFGKHEGKSAQRFAHAQTPMKPKASVVPEKTLEYIGQIPDLSEDVDDPEPPSPKKQAED